MEGADGIDAEAEVIRVSWASSLFEKRSARTTLNRPTTHTLLSLPDYLQKGVTTKRIN